MSEWTREEDERLQALYPKHGPSWEGWYKMLPGRSYRAIAQRASKVGVARGRESRFAIRSPMEDRVLRYFKMGLTPSEIDRLLALRRGAAHDLVCGAWLDDKERNGYSS